MPKGSASVLFIVPYPTNSAASQRFRFEQYLDFLKESDIDYQIQSFLDKSAWNHLYQKGNYYTKGIGMLKGIFRRYSLLFRMREFEVLFIHREFNPLGINFLPWIFKKVFRKKIIFDFDDAIWIPNSSSSNRFFSFLKVHSNAKRLMKLADVNSCGNTYLRDFALQYNKNSIVVPTTIDTSGSHNEITTHSNRPLVIGWTGTHSTIHYLNEIIPILKELSATRDFEFRVISDEAPNFELKGLKFMKWNLDSEIQDLIGINIGVMPLKEDQWSSGKCGLKILQYMSLGIPSVSSPVGVNSEIIEHGKTGYLCSSASDWKQFLTLLLDHPEKVVELGSRTREVIIDQYSNEANKSKFLHLFA